MEKAETGFLLNSSHYILIALDQWGKEGIYGAVYHESRSCGIMFDSLVSLIGNINYILGELKCLRESVEIRKFSKADKPFQIPGSRLVKGEARSGTSATFRLFLKSRYFASWQGYFCWVEGGITNRFDSFLNLMIQIDQILHIGNGLKGFNESNCENEKIQFSTAMRLLEELEGLDCRSEYGVMNGIPRVKMMPNYIFWAFYKKNRNATFIVKVLFKKNSSWQGNICWKENCEQISFRSFLELLILMDSALDHGYEPELTDFHVSLV